MQPVFHRVLLKISGEALAGDGQTFDPVMLDAAAEQVLALVHSGVQTGVVIGAGNIWRGRKGVSLDMNPNTADAMGMLATVVNSLALKDAVERAGGKCLVQCAFPLPIADAVNAQTAVEAMENGAVVIFAGGTGNPFFSTDTAAVLRALQIRADVILMAKSTDYVYTEDPKKHPDTAVPLPQISYAETLARGLRAMDTAGIALCMEYNMPSLCFTMKDPQNIRKVVSGQHIGTILANDPDAFLQQMTKS